jgi:hypothetical protein
MSCFLLPLPYSLPICWIKCIPVHVFSACNAPFTSQLNAFWTVFQSTYLFVFYLFSVGILHNDTTVSTGAAPVYFHSGAVSLFCHLSFNVTSLSVYSLHPSLWLSLSLSLSLCVCTVARYIVSSSGTVHYLHCTQWQWQICTFWNTSLCWSENHLSLVFSLFCDPVVIYSY